MKRKITSKTIYNIQQKYHKFIIILQSLIGVLFYIGMIILGVRIGILLINTGDLIFGWGFMLFCILFPPIMFLIFGVPMILDNWKEEVEDKEN